MWELTRTTMIDWPEFQGGAPLNIGSKMTATTPVAGFERSYGRDNPSGTLQTSCTRCHVPSLVTISRRRKMHRSPGGNQAWKWRLVLQVLNDSQPARNAHTGTRDE